jgi:hypothetical protein
MKVLLDASVTDRDEVAAKRLKKRKKRFPEAD